MGMQTITVLLVFLQLCEVKSGWYSSHSEPEPVPVIPAEKRCILYSRPEWLCYCTNSVESCARTQLPYGLWVAFPLDHSHCPDSNNICCCLPEKLGSSATPVPTETHSTSSPSSTTTTRIPLESECRSAKRPDIDCYCMRSHRGCEDTHPAGFWVRVFHQNPQCLDPLDICCCKLAPYRPPAEIPAYQGESGCSSIARPDLFCFCTTSFQQCANARGANVLSVPVLRHSPQCTQPNGICCCVWG